MRKAVLSVIDQRPDEYVCYVDPVSLSDESELETVLGFLEASGVTVKFMEVDIYEDHYAECCRQVYEAIRTARHPWVLDLDDDDEFIGQVPKYLELTSPAVGAIYGHKIQRGPEVSIGDHRVRQDHHFARAWDVTSSYTEDIVGMRGSAIMYNREAFRRIRPNLDIYRGPRGEDFGYWWEYKIGYWLLRAGYLLKSIGDVSILQNLNYERPELVNKLAGRWMEVVLDRATLPFLEEASS
jgi:hypothetical protein